jgi:hypothetical protein
MIENVSAGSQNSVLLHFHTYLERKRIFPPKVQSNCTAQLLRFSEYSLVENGEFSK